MATEVIREHHYDVEPPRYRIASILGHVVDLLFGILQALLLIRFALVFFGARQGAGFYQLIHDWTEPFYRPFQGLFTPSTFAGFHLEWSLLVAMAAYALLHALIRGVMSLVTR